MKTSTIAFAAVALSAVTGCGDYYYEGRGVSSSYGQSGVVYNQAEVDPNAAVAVSADGQTVAGQDVYVGASTTEYSDTDPAALTDFRTSLDPYGQWVEDGTYGTVWVPSSTVVGTDFVPYVSSGHWTYGNDYTWVSDYEWGWAPFHYGRWVFIDGRGWSWIPGRTYSGAWVTWRTGYDGWGYVGWAPMPPTWYWHGGVAVGIGVVPVAPYTFCASGDVFHPSVATRVVGGQQVGVVAQHTRPYTPATPTVGDRTPATPSVGGSPNGLGPQHIGPPPSSLGLADNQIAHAPVQDRGLLRAQQFSRPSTATIAGARPPINSIGTANNGTYRPSTTVATGPVYNHTYGTPQYRPTPVPSQSQTYQPSQAYHPSPTYQPSQSYTPSRTYSPPSYSPPAHAYSPPTYAPSQSYTPSRSYSPPSFSPSRSYSPSVSSGSFHGSSPSPSFGSSRPSVGGGARGGRR